MFLFACRELNPDADGPSEKRQLWMEAKRKLDAIRASQAFVPADAEEALAAFVSFARRSLPSAGMARRRLCGSASVSRCAVSRVRELAPPIGLDALLHSQVS